MSAAARPPCWDALLAGAGLPRLEARVLLAAAAGRRPEWLIAHGAEPADAAAATRFGVLAGRRRDGFPIAYLTGLREFRSRSFGVSPAVLIPRPETEELVALVLARLPANGGRLLDLGTGSGVIAISVALERPDVAVTATDVSPAALAVARDNARRLGTDRIAWCTGDWWQALPSDACFDVIASNPPYVAAADPHLARGDLRFEPSTALVSGPDGLDACRRLIADAPARLAPGGHLLLEHGADQAAAVRALMARAGLEAVRTHADAAGLDRIGEGRRPGG